MNGLVNAIQINDSPGIRIEEKGDELIAKVKLLEFSESEIDVEATKDRLFIKATKTVRETVTQGCYLAYENSIRSVEASKDLPYEVNIKNISHTYKNGVLEVKLTKI